MTNTDRHNGSILRMMINEGPETSVPKELVAYGLGFANWKDLLFCLSASDIHGDELENWLSGDCSKASLLAASPQLRRLQKAGDTP